jgi:hypothetical protein
MTDEGRRTVLAKIIPMRAMAFVWAVILIGGIAYFTIIGLTQH